MANVEEIDIVIVGGGICGLATALALHRKDIKSVVLERAETLRATGVGIVVQGNGWRAFKQLGVDVKLRSTAVALKWLQRIENGDETKWPMSDEARCLLRSSIIETLAEELPSGTVRLGVQVQSIVVENSSPIIQLQDGSFIKAKILIGCDGANSMVARFLGIRSPRVFDAFSAVRGRTVYPNGHNFIPAVTRIREKDNFVITIPIDEKTVYWSVCVQPNPKEYSEMVNDISVLQEKTTKSVYACSPEIQDMVKTCDPNSLSLTQIRYRAPWDLVLENFRKGPITVSGDALHVSGPFVGQGGAAALEDAAVLARCLSNKLYQSNNHNDTISTISNKRVEEALDAFLKERRPRLLRLSTETYLIGRLVGNSSLLAQFLCIVLMILFFRNPLGNTKFDCGKL